MTIPNFDVASSNKAINTGIRNIRKSQETNNTRVHKVMVLIATHSERTNDCSGFARLLNQLPAGLARNASVIISTMTDYTPIQARKTGEGFACSLAKVGSANYKDYDLQGLSENPWYLRQEANSDPAILTVDGIGDKIMKLADSIGRKIKKGEADSSQTDALTLLATQLRAFAKKNVPDIVPVTMAGPVANSNDAEMAEAALRVG